MNKHSFKYSGLANRKAVGLVANADKGVTLLSKSKVGGNQRKPAKLYNKSTLTRDFRRVAKTIKNETGANFYRPDLQKAALARWNAIYRSQKAASGVSKKKV